MFKSFFLISSLALFFATTISSVAIDNAASTITWKGYKVTGSHEGTIDVEKGNLEFTDGLLTGGSFAINMTSLKATDVSGGMAQKLEGHLKSADFFGVEEHPLAMFTITKVVSRGTPGDYRITGDITIKEHTESIRFNATVTEADGVYTAKADLKLDRTDFDIRYGSGSFIDNLGDKTIYDEFDLGITLVTAK